MRCQECGAEIMEGLDYCPKCDTPVAPPPPPEKKNIWRIICSAVLALALVAGVLFLFSYCSNDSEQISQEEMDETICTELTKRYVEFFLNGKWDKILDLMPPKLAESAADEMDMTVQEMREYFAEEGTYKKFRIEREYGMNWKYSFTAAPSSWPVFMPPEIGKIEEPDYFDEKKFTDSQFNELKKQYDFIGLELEDARKVITHIKISGNITSSQNPLRVTVITVKIDGTWYLGAMAE